MNEIKFKVLMKDGVFIDRDFLVLGLFECKNPHLFDRKTTIESLIKEATSVSNAGLGMGDYVSNLSQCELVDITLKIE